jgi:HEPN domain-containing protein
MVKCKTKSEQQECPAGAFLNMAKQYHLAATVLFPLGEQMESPLYFLYTHTLELAFKTYLRLHNHVVPRTHELQLLLEKCADYGFCVSRDLKNIVHLLEYENKFHGFRYFTLEDTARPEINYLRAVVDDLMVIVIEEMKKRPNTNPPPPKKVICRTIVGKPVKKKN